MSTADDLKRAYQLIKEDNPQEAESLLIPILQSEPENVDAWWLMAYAVENPIEVREALSEVLRLNPNYVQAPKAREMLAKIDEEYPPEPETPSAAADEFAAVFGASSDEPFATDDSFDTFDDSGFEEFDADSFDTPVDDTFDDAFGGAFEAPEDDLMGVDELFEAGGDTPSRVIIAPDKPMDEETQAAFEEKAARRQGRGRRLLLMLLFVIVVGAGVVAAVTFVLSQEDESASDPGTLQTVNVESTTVNQAVIDANVALAVANLSSNSQALIAHSRLGNTLFVRVCDRPGPNLPESALAGMEIAAQQAPRVQGELAAVGVSVESCSSPVSDTYYRAYVSVEAAQRFIDNGGLAQSDQAIAQFQALWQEE